jgi:hypothetical protein
MPNSLSKIKKLQSTVEMISGLVKKLEEFNEYIIFKDDELLSEKDQNIYFKAVDVIAKLAYKKTNELKKLMQNEISN